MTPAPAPDVAEIFVKICGITSEADALLCVSLGADAVGFIFAPSVRQVSVQLAGDIAKRLPPETMRRLGLATPSARRQSNTSPDPGLSPSIRR